MSKGCQLSLKGLRKQPSLLVLRAQDSAIAEQLEMGGSSPILAARADCCLDSALRQRPDWQTTGLCLLRLCEQCLICLA